MNVLEHHNLQLRLVSAEGAKHNILNRISNHYIYT